MTPPGDIPSALRAGLHDEAQSVTRSVLDSLTAHIAVVDGAGTIVLVNRAWEEFARENGRLSLDGLGPGTNYLAVCDGSSGAYAEEASAVAAGLRAVLAGERPSFSLEYPCHSPTTKRWFHLSVTPLAGGVAGAVISHHNISARVVAEHERDAVLAREQAARRNAEHAANRNALLYAVTSALSAAVNPEDVARVVVDQCLAAFGGRGGALLGLTEDRAHLEVVYAVGYDPGVLAQWQRFPLDRQVMIADAIRHRLPLFHESAESFGAAYPEVAEAIAVSGNQAFAAIPIVLNERVFGGIALSFETRRSFSPEERAFAAALGAQCAQALERARLFRESQLAVEVRNDLLSSVSHDLRTPLAAIKGTAQLLARQATRLLGDGAAPLVDGLTRIDGSTTRMTSLLQELLDAARLRAGEPLELQRAPTDLVALVERAVAEHQQHTPQHRFQVLTEGERLMGDWDASRLARVLDNLLSNAVKYSPNGGEITVSLAASAEAEPPEATVTVTDQGIGIPARDLPFVFERYRRASNVRGQIAGNGLGLAGAKQIIEQHGGSLTIASEEGSGTSVTVVLPVR